MAKFIEVHSIENKPVLVNLDNVISIEQNDDNSAVFAIGDDYFEVTENYYDVRIMVTEFQGFMPKSRGGNHGKI